jgi:hypothetical protein
MTTAVESHDHEEEENGRCVVRYPRKRMDDEWMELEMCDFHIDEAVATGVHIIMQELEELQWKSGLIIEGVELRPKS